MTSSEIQTKELRYSWVEVLEQQNSWLKTSKQPTKKYSEKFSIRKGSSFCDTLEFNHEKKNLLFLSGTDISSTQEDYDVASSSFIGQFFQVYFHFRYRKAKSLIPVRGRVAKPEFY